MREVVGECGADASVSAADGAEAAVVHVRPEKQPFSTQRSTHDPRSHTWPCWQRFSALSIMPTTAPSSDFIAGAGRSTSGLSAGGCATAGRRRGLSRVRSCARRWRLAGSGLRPGGAPGDGRGV